MNDFEQAIRQSLSTEDAALLDRLSADQALHRQVLATFEVQRRWYNAAGGIAGVVLFGVACVLAWRFVHATELREMLRWGAAPRSLSRASPSSRCGSGWSSRKTRSCAK